MTYHPKQCDIQELLIRFLENDLDDSQRAQLLGWSRSHSKAAKEYCDFIKDYAIIGNVVSGQIEPEYGYSDDTQFDHALWAALEENQNAAPEIEIPKEKPQRELIQKVVYPPREKRKMSRYSIVFLAMNAAAILFFILFLRLAPSRGGIEVATLTDSIDAKWANSHTSFRKGFRFVTAERMLLLEGLAEILFDDGVKVTLEAPAEFQLLTHNQINLHHGRLYAIVPQGAIGFTVNTQAAGVIDLGTEFGIDADSGGDVSLYVLKGQTTLITGKQFNKVSMNVSKGNAKKISADTSAVVDIPCNIELFAREINSENNFIWRGQNIDLADVTCGGNGFGSGNPQMVIDPTTGETQQYIERGFGTRYAKSSFSKTESLRYVDGVFVPDGGEGPIIISSAGSVFEACPDTSGAVRKDVSVLNKIYQKNGGSLKVNDIAYGYPYRPAITLQANVGITFDLNAIRKDMKGFDITYFETLCAVASDTNGVYETADPDKRPTGKADFWILIDGRVQKTIQGVRMGFSEAVRFPIRSDDRFLTIITTDHMESRELDPIGWDRCFLGDPVLGFESLD